MKKIAYLSTLAICSSLIVMPVWAGSNFTYTTTSQTQTPSSLQGQVTYVPVGTVTSVMLSNEISSETATAGNSITATLVNDLTYNNTVVASSGSIVTGTIIKAKKAGYGNKNGQIQVVFNSITTPQGYNIPINAVFKTDDNSGILKGGTALDSTKDYAKDAVVGAGAGAVLGTAMGALSSGSVGKGAVYGTALGGGLGLAKGVATKGDNLTIPASSCLDIYFTQPVTVSAPAEYTYEY